MEPPKDKDSDRLLNDENFAELMESEYNRVGRPVDELAKKRVWEKLRNEAAAAMNSNAGTTGQVTATSKFALARKLQMLTVLAAGLGAVFLSLRFFEKPLDEGQRIKGSLGDIQFQVGMYEQKEDGELVPFGIKAQRRPGLTIVPFVKSEVSAVVLLVKRTGSDEDVEYVGLSDAEMVAPGEEHYFSKDSETIAVETEKEVETYCAVIADSMNAMTEVISALPGFVTQRSAVIECFSL